MDKRQGRGFCVKESHIVISKATVDRLPLYFRSLKNAQEEGLEIISSEDLGKRIGITPEQIRKDLSLFGEFGKKGVGYYVRDLIRNIGEILGLHRNWNIALVGVGHLGWALANYHNFSALGFNLVASFDTDPGKIGAKVNEVPIYSPEQMEEIIQKYQVTIGVITVPAEYAQGAADRLIKAGVRGIWNFAPVKLNVPETVKLINEDLSIGLSSLSYYLSRQMPNE